MKNITRTVIGLLALLLTTYFVAKGIALRIPVTIVDRVLFFIGLALAFVYNHLYWKAKRAGRHRDGGH